MNKFILVVSDLIKMECKKTFLVKEMDISRIMAHDEQTESEKFKMIKVRESKRARFDRGFFYAKSSGGHFPTKPQII